MKTKQITKAKALTGSAMKALLTAPIGGTPVPVTVPKASAANVAPKATTKKTAEKKTGLWFFQQTPAGRILRAYFVAYIMAQTGGKLAIGKIFKLWPNANIRGHLDTGKVARKDHGYALTVPGYNYFTDSEQEADKDMVRAMSKAIKSGSKPDCYKFTMSQSSK